ncbi:hypothetical protein BU15DRAFT_61057 [Melanogaster broomeanus]|nr:hypothetical protein BU15DRAFT_61057 [Melanogaster broomeanus]
MSCPTTDSDLSLFESLDNLDNIPIELQLLLVDRAIAEAPDNAIALALRSLRDQLQHPRLRVLRPQLEAVVQRPAVLRSPVKRLPPEILANIFHFCAIHGSDMERGRALIPNSLDGHQLLLLRLLPVPVRKPHERRVQSYTGFGHVPEDFILSHLSHQMIYMLVERLRNNSRRWKSISLQLPGDYFPLLFIFTPCDLASLQHFSINGSNVDQGRLTVAHLNLESATDLKSFAYDGPPYSVDDRISVAWNRLTEVSLGFASRPGITKTLCRYFRQLAQCNITTCSLGLGKIFRADQPITLPYLRTLRVRPISFGCHARSIMDVLILPQLQTLEIDAVTLVTQWTERWHDRQFSKLLSRSSCSLERLHIQNVYFPINELLRCLARSRDLKSLCFIPCPRYDISSELDVSRVAGAELVVSPIVPRLQELKLPCTSQTTVERIMKMVVSRVGASANAAGVDALQRLEMVVSTEILSAEVESFLAKIYTVGRSGPVPEWADDLLRRAELSIPKEALSVEIESTFPEKMNRFRDGLRLESGRLRGKEAFEEVDFHCREMEGRWYGTVKWGQSEGVYTFQFGAGIMSAPWLK